MREFWDFWKTLLPVPLWCLLGGGTIGWAAWPHAITLSILLLLALPMVGVWYNRLLLATGYFLAASDGIVHGSVQFFGIGTSLYVGLAFWVISSLVLAAPYALPGRWLILAPLLDVVLPIGMFGWASPLLGIFAWGEFATIYLSIVWVLWVNLWATPGLKAGWTLWPMTMVMVAFSLPGYLTTPAATPPTGWVGVHTSYGLLNGYGVNEIVRDEHLEQRVMHRLQDPHTKVVVLPEAVAGMWYAGTAQLWQPVIKWTKSHHQAVLLGVEYPIGKGYEDTILRIQGGATKVLPDDIAVPVSMWHPWSPGGAVDHLNGTETGTVLGQKVNYLVCYDQLLAWPGLHLLWNEMVTGRKPTVLIGVANDWWTKGTDVAANQRASLHAWGRLLGAPVVSAVNG
ncbi:hypothetical protein HAP94_17860 [Acidithiobacillus ferrivorans]|nr:hypothetical protein [Acidithiobacillus ferrivorans]